MKNTKTPFLMLSLALSVPGLSAEAQNPPNQQVVSLEYLKPAGSRTFAIEYVAKVTAVPDRTTLLRGCMPVPQASTVHSIRELGFSRPPRLATEPKYGNRIACWEIKDPGASNAITMKFVCRREEVRLDLARLASDGEEAAAQFVTFKRADKLVL